MEELTLKKFEEAAEKVKEATLPTNLIFSEYFSNQTGNKVYLKPENMQYTGAYKVRGAYYKISTMSPRTGCCICGKEVWRKGYCCYANNNTTYKG